MLTQKDRKEIAAMFVELMNAVPNQHQEIVEVTEAQCSKPAPDISKEMLAIVLKNARWLKNASVFFKGKATHVMVSKYCGSIYYHLANGEGERIGMKNRQLRRRKGGSDYYSIPFGTQPLPNATLYKL
ncbi:MAG TPA: hypothetical protein PKM59_16375 [Thermodesulfobacteriota bacterium]|nr:hypothetical protein [Thermodesulfobacteriota bacterium]HOX87889.1 hypothetical protein [bacterium]